MTREFPILDGALAILLLPDRELIPRSTVGVYKIQTVMVKRDEGHDTRLHEAMVGEGRWS